MKISVDLSTKSSQYYVTAEHWASDLEFFKIEDSFFHHLLNKYVSGPSPEKYIAQLKKLGEELKNLDQQRQQIEMLVHKQLELITWVAENVVPENLEKIEATHVTIELLMTEVTKKYRELKKHLFETVEHLISI